MIEASLPRLEKALEDEDERRASFTVTAAFTKTKKRGIVLSLEPRERIPLQSVEFALKADDGQLELFSGPHAAGEVADMEQPGA